MIKPFLVLGAFGASVSTFSLSMLPAGQDSSPATAESATDVEARASLPSGPLGNAAAPVPEEAPPVRGASPRAQGVRLEPVPTELAVHLGLETARGVLVTGVARGCKAGEAGLAPHDVVVSINGTPAGMPQAEEAFSGDAGFVLDVVSAGVRRRIHVPGVEGDAGFLSTASLGPDHPFRRLGALESLRDGYSEKAEEYSERMRQLDEERGRTRDEAKKEKAALQHLCEEQVAEYLATREEGLLALVDERMDPARVESFRELRIDLSELVTEERVRAIDDDLRTLGELFRNGLRERLVPVGDEVPGDLVNRGQQRTATLGNEAGNLLAERVDRPWTSAVQELDQHRERLGRKYDERVQWTEKTVRETRDKVKERVRCAVERTREQFSQKLRSRLQRMEVPAPGEVEGALADIDAQLDAYARRFILRTEVALDRYEDEVGMCNERLLPGLEGGLTTSETAVTELAAAVKVIVAKGLPETLPASALRWETMSTIDRLYDDARAELTDALNAGRDGTRGGTTALSSELKEHKVVAEDAWRDLKKLLSEVRQAAESDCWKLDGPHLDGRFPRRGQSKKAKGEVVMAH